MTERVSSRDEITQQFVAECFDYIDGALIWKERPLHHFINANHQRVFNKRQGGTIAGTNVSGYIMVRFRFGKIGAHRLIFMLHHGFFPAVVDHINGNPLDNRIENLRAATHSQNMRNVTLSKANSSGQKGVAFHKSTGKWIAYVRVNGKMKHLGIFKTVGEAADARRSAEATYYEGFSRG